MKKSQVTVVAVAILFAAVAAWAGEGRGPGRGMGRRGGRRGRVMRRLVHAAGVTLTEEQKAKIAELRKAAIEKVKAADTPEKKREVFEQLRKDVRAVLTAEQAKKLDALREKARPGLGLTEEQRAKMADIREKAREEMKKVLTEEQIKKFEAFRKRIGARRGHGHRRGRPKGPIGKE